MKWEAQAVRRENGQRQMSLPVFSRSFFLRQPLTPVTPRLPPPPPPSHPNASRWWVLSLFRRDCPLASKCAEVVRFDTISTTFTSLASKCEPEEVTEVVSTRLLPPPPPSRPNASRRWFFSSFRRDSHHHHLPRVPTRAGGGHFRSSNTPPTTTTSLVSKREPEVVFFRSFDPSPTTTSLASKREPEVVSFVLSTRLPPPPPPSRSNASWGWFFRLFRPSATTTTSLASKRELEVVFFLSFRPSATTTTSLASKCEPEVVIFTCFDATQDDWEGHEEGGGARGDDDLLVVVPQSPHQQDPLSFVRGFSSMASTKGWCSYHTPPHSIFFSFCSQQYVFRLYTIKIVITTPRSTTGFFQRLQRGLGRSYFSKDTQGYPRQTWQFEYFQRYPRLPQRPPERLGQFDYFQRHLKQPRVSKLLWES